MRIAARLGATLMAAVLLAAAIATGVAWHAGYRAYVVRSGSMSPAYPAGTLIVDRPVTGRPHVGDVITFRTPAGPVTHRVHALPPVGQIETKGDANRTPDAWKVQRRHVTGHVVRAVPRGGYALVFLQQPTGVPSLVMFSLAVMFAWSLFFPSAPEPGVAIDAHAEAPRMRAPVPA